MCDGFLPYFEFTQFSIFILLWDVLQHTIESHYINDEFHDYNLQNVGSNYIDGEFHVCLSA